MNRVLPILSLCVALLALAFTIVPRDPVIVSAPEPEELPREPDPELRRRLELVEDDNRALWDRVVLLERRAPTVTTDAGLIAPSVAAEVAQLREEVRGVITGEILSNDASRAALKEVIREAEADNQRERAERRQQQQEQRAAEQKAKWKNFAATARLSFQQEQELTRRLEAEDAARRALAEQLKAGTPPTPETFRAMRDQRRETDTAMNALLDDTQKQQYQALRREDRGGSFRTGGNRGTGDQPR